MTAQIANTEKLFIQCRWEIINTATFCDELFMYKFNYYIHLEVDLS